MSLTEPVLAPPLTPADAWDQAASRVTPLGEYLGTKLAGGAEATVPGQVLRQALLAPPAGYPTDEMRVFGPSEPVDVGSPKLDEEGWKQSPHYRPGVPWDEGMTEARAEGLARLFDRDTWHASLIDRYQGGAGGQVLGFLAMAAPSLADPTNFVPLVGAGARAAALARFGTIAGHGLAAGVDAAAGTALFTPLSAATERQMGRDYGLGDAAAEIALGAVVGGLFGTVHGVADGILARRRAAQKLRPDGLQRTLDALDSVNEALARGREADVAPILRTEPAFRRGLLAGTAGPPTFEIPGLARGEPRPGAPSPEFKVTVEPDGHVDVQPRPPGEGERRRVTSTEVQRELGVGHNEAVRIAEERNRTAGVVPRRPGEPAATARETAGAGTVPRRPGETPAAQLPAAGPLAREGAPVQPPPGEALPASLLPRAPERTIGDVVTAQVAREREARALTLTRATPPAPHPSVAEAAPRVGKDVDERQTFLEDAGLEGYDKPLPVEGAGPTAPPGRAVGLQVAELLRGAGRPEAEVGPAAGLVQAFFETMAKRAGVDPAELFSRYRLAVQAGGKAEAGALFQSVALRTGGEDLRAYGVEPGKTYGTREIATAFEARTAAKYGRIARDDYGPEAQARIARWMADEVLHELEPSRAARNGAGWYSHKYQAALDRYGLRFPELLGGAAAGDLPGVRRLGGKKNARDFFTAIVAVTSDGQKAADNFRQATRIYDHFRRTGDLPKVTFGADRNKSINANLRNIMQALEDHGPGGMHRELMQEATVSELARMAKKRGIDFGVKYPADTRLPLAAIVFGPKLGAFYANLMGSHGYLTMDRWWSRTFNRYRGQLLTRVSGTADRPTDARGNPIGLARYKRMVGMPGLTDEQALELVAVDHQAYEARGFKHGPGVPPDVVAREKAANTLYKAAFLGLEDMPFTTADRGFMIRTVEAAREELGRDGHELSTADVQAILWYYEKRLYAEMGARSTADESYLDIADRLTAEAGGPGVVEGAAVPAAGRDVVRGEAGAVPERAGEPFGDSPDHERGAPARPGDDVGGRPGTRLQRTGGAPGAFEPASEGVAPERPGPAAVREARLSARDRARDRGGQPVSLVREGARAGEVHLATFRNDAAVAKVLAEHGISDPAVLELDPARQAGDFHAAITRAKGASPHGAAVHVYGPDEYRGMRLFLTGDGGAGVALKGDDIVSVFSDGRLKGVTNTLIPLAIEQGGRRLDAFDTMLPLLYAAHGMRVAARLPFDDAFAPEGWSRRAFEEYQDGRPDVVFMAHDPGHAGGYVRPPIEARAYAADYDAAVAAQDAAVRGGTLAQGARGAISRSPDGATLVRLFGTADASTFLHESSHLFFDVMRDLAPHAPEVAKDWRAVEAWLGLKPGEALAVEHEERLASAFEAYLREGVAPTPGLKGAFEAFKDWLGRIYQNLLDLGGRPSADIRRVFDRILGGGEAATPEAEAKPAADLPPELQDLEAMRRGGDFTPEDQRTLAAGEAEARTHEAWADAYQTLAGCVLRNAA